MSNRQDILMDFWTRLDNLIAASEVVIDRPKGSSHPRYPDFLYPLNYGYLTGTAGGDNSEIDVWQGSMVDQRLVGVACTVDTLKADAEIKLLLGCTDDEIGIIDRFHNSDYPMSAIIIRRAA